MSKKTETDKDARVAELTQAVAVHVRHINRLNQRVVDQDMLISQMQVTIEGLQAQLAQALQAKG